MTRDTVTDEDEGKRVVNADGETIGMISGIREGKVYVHPNPGLTDKLLARIGWENIDSNHMPLEPEKVLQVTEEEVRLRPDE